MQLRTVLTVQAASDGTTNTFTLNISDLCLSLNISDITPIVDAVGTTALVNLPQGGQASASVTLNPKGTAVTVVISTTPAVGDLSTSLQFFRNI